jgi:glycosyltransferase involved in cell wall biosynthesis
MSLLAKHPGVPAFAVVAGDGPLREELDRRIAESGAPVRLLGARDDIADLLAAADLAVLPSRWEGSPLFAQEVMRAGRPLIATNAGGTPALAGDAAVLVPPDDAPALADAIEALLNAPSRAAEMARRGMERAADWPDEEDVVIDVLRAYGHVLELAQ